MRVLILTHPRSGSYPLANWLGKEINAKVFIDPTEPIKESHCVVRSTNLTEDLSSYDCVVVHHRENTRETAISSLYLEKNPDQDPHCSYTVAEEWIAENEIGIKEEESQYRAYNQMLLEIERNDLIHTTYEQCYIGNESIEAIAELIGMNKPFVYANLIHHSRRYQTLGKWTGAKRGII